MGNSALTISDSAKEDSVVGNEKKFTFEVAKAEKPGEQLLDVVCSVLHKDSSQVLETTQTADGSKWQVVCEPQLAGEYTIKFEGTYQDKTKDPFSQEETFKVFASNDAIVAERDKKAAEKRAEAAKKAAAEAAEAKKMAEQEAAGGPFNLTCMIKSAADLGPGTTITLDERHPTEDGAWRATVNGQKYVVVLKSLRADDETTAALVARIASYPAFPDCDQRRPKKEYPMELTMEDIFKGAVKMKDPFALRHCLARGVDPDTQISRSSALEEACEGYSPVKVASEWISDFGVSCNWSHGEHSTYRQSRECDSLATVILLIHAGAKVTEECWKGANKESFFAKGVKKERLLHVLQFAEKGEPLPSWEELGKMAWLVSEEEKAAEEAAKNAAEEVQAAKRAAEEAQKAQKTQTETEASADGAALTSFTGAQLVTETLKQLSKRAEELGSPLTQEQSVALAKFFSTANATPNLNEEQFEQQKTQMAGIDKAGLDQMLAMVTMMNKMDS